jgi:hypothetical protein
VRRKIRAARETKIAEIKRSHAALRVGAHDTQPGRCPVVLFFLHFTMSFCNMIRMSNISNVQQFFFTDTLVAVS